MIIVSALGISNLVAPYFAAIIPAIGPRITMAIENGSCRMPTPIASRPKPPIEVGLGPEQLEISGTGRFRRIKVKCCQVLNFV